MKRKKFTFRAVFVIASFIIAAIVFVSSATSSVQAQTAPTQTSSNVIQACVDREGRPRIVSTTTTCRRDEQPLSWNKMGIPGAQGAPGPQGPPGTPATPGIQGPQGCPGCLPGGGGAGGAGGLLPQSAR